MSKRQIFILLGILVVFGVAIFVKKLHKPVEYQTEAGSSLVIQFDENVVDRIVMKKIKQQDAKVEEAKTEVPTEKKAEVDTKTGDAAKTEKGKEAKSATPSAESEKPKEVVEQVELIKTDGQWKIPGKWDSKADAERIKRLFKSLSELKGEERGSSEDLYGDFGIKDEQALHVVLYSGSNEALHLLFGQKKAGFQDFFVRKTGSNSVYLASGSLLSDLGIYGEIKDAELKADSWLDLKLLGLKPESIKKIEIKEKGKGKDWREIGVNLPFEKDEAKIKDYFARVANLRATGVEDPGGLKEKVFGFEAPEVEAKITDMENKTITITVGAAKKESSSDSYLQVSGTPQVYTASRYALETFSVNEATLVKANPLGIDKENLESLVVHTASKEYVLSPKKDSWPKLDEYISKLASFSVSGTDASIATAVLPDWIEIKAEGGEPLKISCETLVKDAKDVLCKNEKKKLSFKISDVTYKDLFEDLTRLEKPKPETPAPTATEVKKEEVPAVAAAPVVKPEEPKADQKKAEKKKKK